MNTVATRKQEDGGRAPAWAVQSSSHLAVPSVLPVPAGGSARGCAPYRESVRPHGCIAEEGCGVQAGQDQCDGLAPGLWRQGCTTGVHKGDR